LARRRAPRHLQQMRELEGDVIHVEQLEINARVGVPDIERATPQRLVVSVTVWPLRPFQDLQDDLAQTVDYAAVAQSVRSFVEQRCDRLIETLGSALATHLLDRFTIRAVRIELRKFVMPNCDHVAVIITRERAA
jgi:dihydroneopterin aldolase